MTLLLLKIFPMSINVTIFSVSELIKKSRAQYRTSKGISEDKYIIYINAGTDVAKIKFSFKAFKTGLS